MTKKLLLKHKSLPQQTNTLAAKKKQRLNDGKGALIKRSVSDGKIITGRIKPTKYQVIEDITSGKYDDILGDLTNAITLRSSHLAPRDVMDKWRRANRIVDDLGLKETITPRSGKPFDRRMKITSETINEIVARFGSKHEEYLSNLRKEVRAAEEKNQYGFHAGQKVTVIDKTHIRYGQTGTIQSLEIQIPLPKKKKSDTSPAVMVSAAMVLFHEKDGTAIDSNVPLSALHVPGTKRSIPIPKSKQSRILKKK